MYRNMNKFLVNKLAKICTTPKRQIEWIQILKGPKVAAKWSGPQGVTDSQLDYQVWWKLSSIATLKHFYKKLRELKYGFCNKSFWKEEPLTSWTLLQHICLHFWTWLLLYSVIKPKSENKYVVKVFNWLVTKSIL